MTELTDLSETDDSNTVITTINIAEGCAPSNINNGMRATLGLLRRAFKSSIFRIRDVTDQTKLLAFDVSGLTTATTRTVTVPDKSGTLLLAEDSNAPQNLSLVASVASNALTIAIKGHDGNDPSASNPVYIPFRSVTANSGDVEVLTLTAATSLVVSSGSTLGTADGVADTLVVVGFNDGGTFRTGVINPIGAVQDGIASSTAEGGAGAADSAGVFYTGTAVTSKAYTVLGYITLTEATAGTWATAPSIVQVGNAPSTALAVMPFTKEYVSADQTITFGGLITLAHGLGVAPKLFMTYLVNVTTEHGWSPGDEVLILPSSSDGGSGAISAQPGVYRDATNIYVRYPSAAIIIPSKSAGAISSITPANWRYKVVAWA